MNVSAYWDYDCAGWFFDINDKPIRLPYKTMERLVGKDGPNNVNIEVCVGSEVSDEVTHCRFNPIRVIP